MGKQRQTQHKPARETEAREKSELKQENKALRKQLLKMRRQLQRALDVEPRQEEEDPPLTLALKEVEPGAVLESCRKCGSRNVFRMSVPIGFLIVCRDCKDRRVDRGQEQEAA